MVNRGPLTWADSDTSDVTSSNEEVVLEFEKFMDEIEGYRPENESMDLVSADYVAQWEQQLYYMHQNYNMLYGAYMHSCHEPMAESAH